MVVGESGLDWRDLPHNRHLCRMYVLETVYSRGHANAASCENCWCVRRPFLSPVCAARLPFPCPFATNVMCVVACVGVVVDNFIGFPRVKGLPGSVQGLGFRAHGLGSEV
jgi:hypothetical protein